MDEATSSIDIASEGNVQKAILECFEDSTVITIAHRINTIMHMDKILVLSFGEVKEFDSPSELLKDPGSLFYSIWEEYKKEEQRQKEKEDLEKKVIEEQERKLSLDGG